MIFEKYKTSTRISLLFTVFSSVLFVIFILVLNLYYYYSWNSREFQDAYEDLQTAEARIAYEYQSFPELIERSFITYILSNTGTIRTVSGETYLAIGGEPIVNFFGLYESGDKWYKRFELNFPGFDTVYFPYDVSEHVKEQKILLSISMILCCLFFFTTYWVSFLFSRFGLKKLYELIKYIQVFELNTPVKKFQSSGPSDDEIVLIGSVLENSFQDIQSQSNIMKRFSADVAHEFRTPLMSMNSELDYMIKSGQYEEGARNIKGYIYGLESLVRVLLMIARAEEGNTNIEPTRVGEILKKEIASYQKKYEDTGLMVSDEIDNKFLLNTDATMFQMLVSNIIGNAFKYTKKGSISIKLDATGCSIQDTGIGIHQDEQEKIWERFYRVDASRTDTESFGVGLFLSKVIAEKLGFHITVQSEIGKGSKFRIEF